MFKHWRGFKKRAIDNPLLRKNRLFRFRSKQSCYRKIARQIREAVHTVTGGHLDDLIGKIVLVWGNGSFGPTSRGHASAPNKGMRRGLLPFFPIIICSEYFTSQRCGALGCAGDLRDAHGPTSAAERTCNPNRLMKVLRGRKHCKTCGITWDRDISSSLSIEKIFNYQRLYQSLDRPPQYRRI